MGVAMRASFGALRQRMSLSVEANSQQRHLLAKGISAVAVVGIIGFALHQSGQPDPKTPEVAAKALPSNDAPGFGPSFGNDVATDNPADGIPAARGLGNAELRAVLESVAPKGARATATNDAMATGPMEAAVIHQDSIPPVREIAPPIASNSFSNPAPNSSNSDRAANPAAERQTAPTPVSIGERAKEIAALRRAKLIEDRQEWRYCLAPSYAERRVYLSSPIPSNAIFESAEAVFERTLKKENIAHDEVQCPRAPNKPTLLFRQRYAVRWNQDNGTNVVRLIWRPDSERADKDPTTSQPLVISSTALPVR
jgi:hypothetical protein